MCVKFIVYLNKTRSLAQYLGRNTTHDLKSIILSSNSK